MSGENPYAKGDERHAAYDMAVVRDVRAFVTGDWASIEGDFIGHGFFGLDARGSEDPAAWRLTYPTLASYRDRWLEQSALYRSRRLEGDPAAAIFATLTVPSLELDGDSGVLLKRFDGVIRPLDGDPIVTARRSLFVLRRIDGAWKIAGFVGYMGL